MDPAELSRAFHQQLNEQGYAFHYAVIAEADNQHRLQRSRWALEAVEFPVEVRGRDTRVDIVLRHTRPATQAYMIVECKRANPAFSNWVFVRAPYVRRDPEQGIVLQRLDTTLRPTHSAVHRLGQIADGCHVALECRAPVKGDSGGIGRGQIEDAVAQVLRGVSGFADFLAGNPHAYTEGVPVDLVPVIVTTAHLWMSNAKLESADLSTGNIDPRSASLVEKGYVAYHYHAGPGLRPSIVQRSYAQSASEALLKTAIRTVLVVNQAALGDFLYQYSELLY